MRVQAFGVQEWRKIDRPGLLPFDRLSLLFFLALALSLMSKIVTGWALPLWFDEVYTGTIASQPDLARLTQWCLSEITGPAFYMPMWLWAKVAGTENAALRAPALALSIAGPVLIARWGHPNRNVRLFWAVFSLLWLPMLPMATEARPYPQLFLLGSLQAILFLRLSKSPNLRLGFGWTSVTALFVLTNYYALVISGFQALALMASHRGRLLKLYPALLPLVPTAAWMLFHLSVVLRFASEHGSMFMPLPPSAVLGIPWFLFGPGVQAFLILGLVASTHSLWGSKGAKPSPEAQLVWTGIATFVLIFAIGLFRATLAPRYVTPGTPALLFGLGWWAARLRTQRPVVVGAMLAIFFFATSLTLVIGSTDDRFRDRRDLQFETASAWLMEQPLARLYYLKPAPSPTAEQDAEIAGFFFARAGRPVRVVPSHYRSAMTPLLASDGRAGVLFIGDRRSSDELKGWIERQPARWTCRDFGQTAFAITACRPTPPRSPRGR